MKIRFRTGDQFSHHLSALGCVPFVDGGMVEVVHNGWMMAGGTCVALLELPGGGYLPDGHYVFLREEDEDPPGEFELERIEEAATGGWTRRFA